MDENEFLAELKSIDSKVLLECIKQCFPKWGELFNGISEVYYYTDLKALVNGIFKYDNKICLWASRWTHLNDSEEFKIGLSKFKFLEKSEFSWVKKCVLRRLKNTHLISFSEYKDILPMWKMYGDGGNGVMLIFDTKELLKEWTSQMYPCMYTNTKAYNQTLDMIYGFFDNPSFSSLTDVQKRYVLIWMIILLVSTTKKDDYAYEKEIRLIGLGNTAWGNVYKQEYRVVRNTIIPYVEAFMPKESLKGVCLGPLVNSELNQKTLKEFLHNKGYDNVEVYGSKINYR